MMAHHRHPLHSTPMVKVVATYENGKEADNDVRPPSHRGDTMRKAASALDYRELARRRLPPFLFEYIDGGSYAEGKLRRKIADLERGALRQRVLNDVSAIDVSTELFGRKQTLPVALAPIGLAGMTARR